jgi:amino acid adenylation domain-containing protein
VSTLTKRTADLSPRQRRELLAEILRKKARAAKSYPLSFAQQRLWFLDQMVPGTPLYNVPLAARLTGPLDVGALQKSLNAVVGRHEVLRTTFTTGADGDPIQVVTPSSTVSLPIVDLCDRSGPEQESRIRELVVEEARRPFNLAHGPLLRATLLRLGDRQHVLLLTLHHIISDGWSLGVLMRDAMGFYEAIAIGRPGEVPDLPIQYGDYAIWQRQWLEGEVLETQLDYWKRQLASAAPTIDLPTDYPRPAVQSYRGALYPFELSAELVHALRVLASQEDCTLNMVLLAGFLSLVHRYSGQEDICVGAPIANRTRAETEELVGFFVNTLVLRTDLGGDPSFRALLGRVRETCLGAYAHQDLPFERLVEALKPERDLSRSPLFQVLFVFQNAPLPAFEFAGVKMSQWDVDTGTSKFDLSLYLVEHDGGLRGTLEYSRELFAGETAARLVGHLGRLLEAACADADQPVSRLPLLTPAEEAALADWNATRVDYPQAHLLHRLVAEQAARSPAACAVWAEGRMLSYQALVRRAGRLARQLRSLGVGPDVPVAVCLERCPELLVALLGTLEAGGCFVPLDPGYPAGRLAFLVEDAAPAVLLTHAAVADRLPAFADRVLCLEDSWGSDADDDPAAQAPLPGAPAPEQLAYVLYTSGSTGQPKGAANTHQGICNRLLWMQDAYRLRGTDAVLQKTPCGFDVSVWEFFWPLLAGARLVLARPGGHQDPAYLADLIAAQGVTVCHFVPSLLEVFLREPDLEERCASLRDVICSGEALSVDLQERFCARLPARLHNLYGPTEAAVDVTAWACRPGEPGAGVPIGRPIANVQMHVLDGQLQPLPVGVPGELYIGGVALARGYWRRPELTAERFLEHPMLGRLYRTGDRGRWRADGALEYLGRTDGQVKLRGCRIEPGEVEAALRRCAGVAAALAMVRSDPPGDPRLVAYVVPGADGGHAAGEPRVEQVVQWQTVWEETYNRGAPRQDATFNTVGWDSSYTGLPIPDEEMREWLEHTVARIQSLRPSRLLEIGCGAGLLLFRLAAGCRQYTATDFSESALRFVRQQLTGSERRLPHVSLLRRAAHELDGLGDEEFDTVVLNSVIQYFPSIDYLLRVVEGVARGVKPGGRIFLGDVRNLRLLTAFHASVQLHKAPATLSRSQLLARVKRHAGQERELLVDPDFFSALRQHIPRIDRVEIQLKRGSHHNELTGFRYDVVLHVSNRKTAESHPETRDWQDQALTLPGVRCLLKEEAPGSLSIKRVPNARLCSATKALELLEAPAGPETAHALREALRASETAGVDPEAFWALGEELGYQVELRWSATGGDGCYDVDFRRPGSTVSPSRNGVAHTPATPRPWATYANDPLQGKIAQKLVPELRAQLRTQLPEYMVPSAFVLLEALPLSPNGKVDRKALPAPDQSRPELEEAYAAPRTSVEQALADLWAEVLGIERVGTQDNFFELGGHSLLATQVISRVRKAMQVELPLRALFEAPTVAGLADRIEAIRLATLGLPAAPLRAIPRDGELPLSFGQETFWFLDRLEPDSPVFNIDFAIRLRGPLDPATVGQTMAEVMRRHEALRTTFISVDGRPVAVIAPPAPLSVPVHDLTSLPEAEREGEARRLADEESRRPFDLARGPLFRVSLLRLGAEDHVGLLNVHHAVFDGWSLGIFLREAALLCEGFAAGKPATLPDLPIQYVDFAHWQRQWLKSGLMEEQLAYWKKQLGGRLPVLELPTDHPRPPTRTFHGARRMAVLSPALAGAVHALGRSEGCTLFMVLLGTFQTLLHRYTGQADLCIGTPIAGRNRAETEGLVGFFVNTLVLRTDLGGDPSFRALLERVRETCLGAYAHQDLPFEMLMQSLRPDRDPSRSSLFQVMFILQNAPLKIPSIAGLDAGPFVNLSDNGTSKFDLTLTLMEGPDGLTAGVEYNTDLFEEATILRLLGHYQTLLEAVVADPDRKLSRLSLLTAAERRQFAAWNSKAVRYPTGECAHELFEAQVARTPEAVALVVGDRQVTYRELNRRANRLAHQLREFGVGPEVLVGLYVERAPELLVGILGILKAGGAYVPLDPAYPGERLNAIVEDAGCSVLLTQHALVNDLSTTGTTLLCLDGDLSDEPGDEANLGWVASAEHLAYVIYTSGSTGRPKGVMVTHGALCNAYHGWEDAYRLREEATSHLQMASCAFDVFTGDWVRALCSGGKLVLCPRESLLDPPRLYELMSREHVDCAEFVPAVLRALVQYLEETGGSLAFMRLFVAGSDVWYAGEYRRILRLCGPQTRLINSYGLAEATIDSTYFEGAELDLPEERPVPIGRPFANVEVHILDRSLQPVPVGVPGELTIGGRGLARGYFKQPKLTAEKFIPDPFSGRPGALLCRTGDLARYLGDGSIELLGRTDYQVKIRGFRIEAGEIEAILTQHPAVRQAVVVARGDRPESKQLVAYYVADGAAASSHELRSFLRARLPEYMVPVGYVVLDALPLSPNGKVDRQALPEADLAHPESGARFVAPRTPTEERVAEIWAKVLGVERVGAEDHFFDLGGHSLLATQVIARVAQAFHVELPLRRLFESPTVAGIAESIEVARRSEQPVLPPLERGPREGSLPLSFAQQRLWFLDRFEPGSPFYNIPAAARLTGELDVAALERSLAEIIHRHETLRTTFPEVDGQPAQAIGPDVPAVLSVLDLADLPTAEREREALRLARAEAQRPFDLARGSLLRITLIKLAPREHIVLLVLHHIVSDGWSMGVFYRELVALYQHFTAGKSAALPALPVQYADYARWQRDWLRGEPLEKQLAYWKERLAGVPTALELPTDRPRPPVQTVRGATERVLIPMDLLPRVKDLCQRTGCTPFMALLAAFQAVLARYSGQEDFCIGTPIAGRRRPELEGLIGFFVNTLVLRTDLGGDPSFHELLGRVREACLGAYAHQDLPFEMLVEAFQPQRDLSRTPLFQVLFALQNTPVPSVELPDLSFRPIEAESGTAKFDLGFFLAETEQGLAGSLEYNTDLFDASTARRLLGHFQHLLEAAVTDPARHLSELPLLTQPERQQILGEWNSSETVFPEVQTVHRLFEIQAERTPEAMAIGFEGEVLTYRELNAKANRLAHSLRDFGVGPEVLVGICVERSVDMVVAVLAVLKAGGAYVPLDPAYPAERLAFMLSDAGAPLVLTTESLVARLSGQRARPICLDTDALAIAQQSEANPFPMAGAEHLAYVIYTSGSTGRPKGVEITHASVVNFLTSMRRRPGLHERDILLAVTTLSFDIAALEIFLPLAVGARVELVGRETAQDGARLAERLAVSGATVMQATPATWRLLLEAGWSGGPGLKILCGGEALAPELAQQLLPCGSSVWNLYGPTETTIWSTLHPVDWRLGSVPIGRPIANTQVYIVDDQGQPVPVGVPGELLIGGAGVARGYRRRPELTAEKFIPDPFSGRPGARLYRTGDRARWLHSGALECLGRVDHQVKIRGFRVEPGEIETMLGRHPAVRQVAVLAREDTADDKRLVAYVVPNPHDPIVARGDGAEHLAHWQGVWDEAYARPPAQPEVDFNLAGWTSSYTGLPLAEAEMREWVNHAVERILAQRPARILEIGCGTGLLLFRLAPKCADYTGTDMSGQAIHFLREHVAGCRYAPSITLLERPADDFSGFGEGTFDAVILNSVVQYFPSIDYLLRVLAGAVKATRPGGFVFLGDVRNLALLDAFHAWVQLNRAPPALAVEQLLERVRKEVGRERELVIDPALFEALKEALPAVRRMDVQLKQGRHHNEMTAFRYDVILQVGGEEPAVLRPSWVDYRESGLTPDAVRERLEQQRPEVLALTAVPNARIPAEVKVLQQSAGHAPRTVGELRQDVHRDAGVDPDELWLLGESLPYAIDMRWTAGANDGRFDLVFRRRDRAGLTGAEVAFPGEVVERRPWREYANDPLRGKAQEDLVPRLREYLRGKLPEYMVPSAFVLLDALPRTPNGKLDRKRLAAQEPQGPDSHRAYVAPRDPTEQLLTALWAEVLRLEQVSILDNFFDLGGHSLQAAQLVSRASKAFQCTIPVKTLFLHPTVAAFAEAMRNNAANASPAPQPGPGSSVAVPLTESRLAALARHLTLEPRPLLPLFESGELAPVEAAAIGYLPTALLQHTALGPDEIIHGWCGGRPVVSGLYETPLGRIGLLLIPRFDSQLYQEPEDLVRLLTEALQTARKLGARTVSLTGLLPSATRYGLALQGALPEPSALCITTGHATTTAAIVLSVQRILKEAGRSLPEERVGFLGLGSVGAASLRALLRCLPHPREIRLCDVYSKREALLELRRELIEPLGFRGPVHVLESRGTVPPELYTSSLLVGATNVPDILNVDRLAPGTVLVDDSSPHCFRLGQAIRRLRAQQDILFTDGGMLRAPWPLRQTIYLPSSLEQFVQTVPAEMFAGHDPHHITGCVLSGLLSAQQRGPSPTVGLPTLPACLAHYEVVTELGFQAAALHCDGFTLDERTVQAFRRQFGREADAERGAAPP